MFQYQRWDEIQNKNTIKLNQDFLKKIFQVYENTRKYNMKNSKNPLYFDFLKIMLTDKEILQFILEGIPQIGPKTSQKLLKKYKTIKKFSNVTKRDLEKVIGKKSIEVHRILNKKY